MKGIIIAALMLLPLTGWSNPTDMVAYQKAVPIYDEVTKEEVFAWLSSQRQSRTSNGALVKPTPDVKGLRVLGVINSIGLTDEEISTIHMLWNEYAITRNFFDEMCPLVSGKSLDQINTGEVVSLSQDFVRDGKAKRRQFYQSLRANLDKGSFNRIDAAIDERLATKLIYEPSVEEGMSMTNGVRMQKFMWQNNCYYHANPTPDITDEWSN